MALSLQSQREFARWYPLREHPVQRALVEAVSKGIRFPLVPAGRRSGKTERAKRFVAKNALSNPGEIYFVAAPTYAQVKKAYWADMKLLCLTSMASKAPSESDLIIYLDNATQVHLIGLDKPQRMEGSFWSGGVIDEIADVKADAWEVNIRPALDTFNPQRPGYRAWCWLIGVPEGLNHYYDMVKKAESGADPESAVFHWKSSEILPADMIAAAKRQMSAKQFRQEYEAAFEGSTGRIYEDYDKQNHTSERIQPHEQLMFMHDFNFTPMSSAIGVQRGSDLYLLDEIILTSAVARQSAMEFVEKFKDHANKNVLIYGDPAGQAGEKHAHASDYTDIEGVLRASGWTYKRKVKPAHPAIKDRQNAVRAKVCTADGVRSLFVNPVTAPWCDKGMATVQLQEGSTFQEDQKNKYQHVTTAIGYLIDVEWPAIKRIASSTPLRM